MNTHRWTMGLLAAAACGLATPMAGADIQSYSLAKGRLYEQESAQAPTLLPGVPLVFLASLYSNDLGSVVDASFENPGGLSLPLATSLNDNELTWEQPIDSETTMNLLYPSGNYAMNFDTENDGLTSVTLAFPSTPFPTAVPQITNFEAAQSIDATADFTLTWNAFTGATGEDHYELSIVDDNGSEVFSARDLGTSITILAGILPADQSFEGRLRFVKEVSRDTTSYGGALGTVEVYNQTSFSISTEEDDGGGGGGDDTTAPVLARVSPANGATAVPVSSLVTFTFSEPMAATEAIQWTANGSAINVLAFWGPDTVLNCVPTAGFPSGATIAWTLNGTPNGPSNFKDAAGNFLPMTTGSFTIAGGGPVDPCDGSGEITNGTYYVSKSVTFMQTPTTAPALDVDDPPHFVAGFLPPPGKTIATAAVRLPGGTLLPLSGFQGTYFISESEPTPAALEAAYPVGTYVLEVTGGTLGNASGSLALGAIAGLPTPQFLNLPQLVTMDPTRDFTLTFAPFAGASATDEISVSLNGRNGNFLYWPDECRNRPLAITATSVVIPANTFAAGEEITGTVQFGRDVQDNLTSIPGAIGFADASVETRFTITLGSTGPATPPVWLTPKLLPGQMAEFVLQAETGKTYFIETATQLNNWTPHSTSVAVGGLITVQVSTVTPGTRFFRARAQ